MVCKYPIEALVNEALLAVILLIFKLVSAGKNEAVSAKIACDELVAVATIPSTFAPAT